MRYSGSVYSAKRARIEHFWQPRQVVDDFGTLMQLDVHSEQFAASRFFYGGRPLKRHIFRCAPHAFCALLSNRSEYFTYADLGYTAGDTIEFHEHNAKGFTGARVYATINGVNRWRKAATDIICLSVAC